MLLASNAVWHLTFYSNTTNKAQIALIPSASKTYCLQDQILVRKGRKRKHLDIDEPSTSSESQFTRSSTSPLNSSLCFFYQVCVCQEQFIKVSNNSACEAHKLSQNAVFRQNKIEYFNRNLIHMQLTSGIISHVGPAMFSMSCEVKPLNQTGRLKIVQCQLQA